MRIQTALTRLIGIEHPIVQTGMGWVAGARLVSATANAGGLGILASATMTIDELAGGGRFVLGWGVGGHESLGPFGLTVDRPVRLLAEALRTTRAMKGR